MKINYTLSNEDFLQYQLYNSSNSKLHKKRRFRSRVIIPILYIIFGFYLSVKNQDIGIGILFAVIGILWFVLHPLYSKWRYKNHFLRHVEESYKNRIDKFVEIEILENAILARDSGSESKITSSELKELIETQEHFFIKLVTDTSVIVPKKSLDKISEFKSEMLKQGIEYINELNWKWS